MRRKENRKQLTSRKYLENTCFEKYYCVSTLAPSSDHESSFDKHLWITAWFCLITMQENVALKSKIQHLQTPFIFTVFRRCYAGCLPNKTSNCLTVSWEKFCHLVRKFILMCTCWEFSQLKGIILFLILRFKWFPL